MNFMTLVRTELFFYLFFEKQGRNQQNKLLKVTDTFYRFLTLKSLRTQVSFGSINLPATPESRAFVNHEVPLIPVSPVQVQVLVLETKKCLILALPVLQGVALVARKEQNLDPVSDLSSAQTQLQLETEEAILRGPAELLLLGVGIADSYCDGGGALHLHTLVVVLIVDQEGAAVWRQSQNRVSGFKHTRIS